MRSHRAVITLWAVLAGAMPAVVSGGPVGPRARLADLERRMAALEAQLSGPPLELAVDCAGGQTVTGALAAAAKTLGPVRITLSGVCAEKVVIDRDQVTLQGTFEGDGLSSPSSTFPGTLLTVSARNVDLRQVTLYPATQATGLEMLAGSVVRALALHVRGGSPGILVWEAASAEISSSEVMDGPAAMAMVQVVGGHLQINETTFARGGSALSVSRGGTVGVFDSSIGGHGSSGVSVFEGSHVTLIGTTIAGGRAGLFVSGATVSISGGRIADSATQGITLQDRASLTIGGGAIVEGHHGIGIMVYGGSVAAPVDVIVRSNGSHGIALLDTSLLRPLSLTNRPAVTDNGAFGLFCASAPAVAQVTPDGLQATAVTGNAWGATNCPTLRITGRVP